MEVQAGDIIKTPDGQEIKIASVPDYIWLIDEIGKVCSYFKVEYTNKYFPDTQKYIVFFHTKLQRKNDYKFEIRSYIRKYTDEKNYTWHNYYINPEDGCVYDGHLGGDLIIELEEKFREYLKIKEIHRAELLEIRKEMN